MDTSIRKAGVPEFALPVGDESIALLKPSLELGDGDRFSLEFDLSWEDWQRAEAAGAFHLGTLQRGPVFGGALLPGQPVRLQARLAPGLHDTLAASEDIFEAGARLLIAEPDAPLRRPTDWIVANVTQERAPGFWAGFSTQG